jgi:2-octaprenyl-6-methoxyphenol hydroxylase
MSGTDTIECDVLIVGGGLVGSLLANALSVLPLSVVLVEARDVSALEQPSFDGRATALANGSQRVLRQLGLWDAIRSEAEPIRAIHIGQRGYFGAARIDAREEGVRALGYMVENRVLGAALWAPLDALPGFRCLAPAALHGLERNAAALTARVDADGVRAQITTRLLVAADGARSSLRSALGIEAQVDDYGQQAIVVNCTTEQGHAGRAFERFTPDGPLAVLPLTRGRVAVVWTLPEARAEAVVGLDDSRFRDALQAVFGYRLGHLLTVGRRDRYPLSRVRSDGLTGERAVLIGNAANTLHPVAGQGFNLALRDVACLAECIADSLAAGERDVGSAALLDSYRAWRRQDQRKLTTFTHALVHGFGTELPGLGTVRGAGLVAFDLIPGAKSSLARHTMGLAGRVPRLARFVNLV